MNRTHEEQNIVLAYNVFCTVFESCRILVHIVLIIFVFLFRKKQPLKSRFVIPYLNNLAMIADSLIFIPFFWVGNQGRINDYLRMYFDYPIFCIAFTACGYHAIRYLLIRTICQTKMLQYANESESGKLSAANQTRKLKWLVSNTAMWSCCAIVLVLWLIFVAIINVLFETNTIAQTTASIAINLGIMVICIALLIVVMTVLVIDTIINWRDLWSNGRITLGRFFLETDPHRFRAELPVLLVTLSIGLTYEAVLLYGILSGFDYVDTAKLNFVNEVVYGAFSFSVFLFGGGVAFFFTLYISLKGVYNDEESVKETEFFTVLHDESKGQVLIEQYCKNEFSFENFMIWVRNIISHSLFQKDIQKIKTTKGEKKINLMNELYSTYIKKGTLMEVNIADSTRVKVQNRLVEPDLETSSLDDVVSTLEREIHLNLKDTFMRFKETNQYKAYKVSIELSTELQGKLYSK